MFRKKYYNQKSLMQLFLFVNMSGESLAEGYPCPNRGHLAKNMNKSSNK